MTALRIPDEAQRRDLTVFAARALRLDDATVIRLRVRSDGLVGAWVATGFDVLAGRVVAGEVESADVTLAAGELRRVLEQADSGWFDAGAPMNSAWRGAIPPETGFAHLDDVPVEAVTGLARQGAELARDNAGPQGPPASLLDQEVLRVSSATESASVPMRCVFALAAMGFMPDADGEVVRVRATPTWLRIDARYGSVFRRRGGPAVLLA